MATVSEPRTVVELADSAPLCRLITLLDQPLFARSVVHSEQILQVLSSCERTHSGRHTSAAAATARRHRYACSEARLYHHAAGRTEEARAVAACGGQVRRCCLKAVSGARKRPCRCGCRSSAGATHRRGGDAAVVGIAYNSAAASADQDLALLRLLRVLAAVATGLPPSDQIAALSFCDELVPLWEALGVVLSRLPPTRADAAGALLPLIQAFFEAASVTQKDMAPQAVTRVASSQSLQSAAAATAEDEHVGGQFGAFVTQHRVLLNALVRQNPSLLDGALGVLVKVKGVLDFDNKRIWFRNQVCCCAFVVYLGRGV